MLVMFDADPCMISRIKSFKILIWTIYQYFFSYCGIFQIKEIDVTICRALAEQVIP
jgi:hypothetical protein